MNQEKVGKFIAELRKEKGITQEELAKEFGITSQSISKWERGVNSPDISFLPTLSKKLGVSVEEILQGEKNNSNKKENSINKEKVIVDSMKFYEKRARNKALKKSLIIFAILAMLLVTVSVMYCVSNYNRIKIYSIYSENDDNLDLSGKIIFNPRNKMILINGIKYNDIYTGTNKELKAKAIDVSMVANDKVFFSTGTLDYSIDSELKTINSFLDNILINISYEDNEMLINNKDLENLYLVLKYINADDEFKELKYKINTEKEFSNNNIFYK